MPPKERFAYKVSLDADETIPTKVTSDSCRCVGNVTELSLTGATVGIAMAEAPMFALGDNVTLELTPEGLKSVRVLAKVQSRFESDEFRIFGFAFPNPSVLRARLSAGLLRLFNERQAYRVEPSAEEPVDVTISCPGFSVTGQMRDISSGGVSVIVDLASEQVLSKILAVDVEFRLPGQPQPLAFQGVIRNRRDLNNGKTMVMGLSFEADHPAFVSQQRHVTNYVVVRERELRESVVET